MQNPVAMELEQKRAQQAYEQACANQGSIGASREMTVGEFIDDRIHKFQNTVKALQDLRDNLPAQFLNSPASRISGLA
jgi:hypothetical protein